MTVRCRIAGRTLTAVMDGRLPSGPAGAHIRTCLRCQAEAARYRALGRRLRSLAGEEMSAPAWLPTRVMLSLDGPTVRARASGALERAALTGAALAIFGAAVVLGWRRRVLPQ